MTSTLGERIRARRQRRRWTLKELSTHTGLSIPYLSDLERDEDANPTLEKLTAIAGALECEVSDLLGGQAGTSVEMPLSISLQRFVNSEAFEARLKRLADRTSRNVDEALRREAIDFLAHAPKRAKGELSSDGWKSLLDFYTGVIADHDQP